MMFLGVDVHLNCYTIACLDEKLNIVDICNAYMQGVCDKVKQYTPRFIGIDAPYGLNTGLMDDENYRKNIGLMVSVHRNKKVSEYELAKRNIQAFSTPGDMSEIIGWKTWMKSGFNIYSEVEKFGYKKINEDNFNLFSKGLVEVFPHASFSVLLGYIPYNKNTIEGLNDRIRILNEVGIKNISGILPVGVKEKTDYLDAISAAYTAYSLNKGIVSFLGDKIEGQIALPTVQIKDKYRYISKDIKSKQNRVADLSLYNTEYSYKNVDSVIWLKRLTPINNSKDIYNLLDLKSNPDAKIRMTITNESSESIEVVFEKMVNRSDGIKPSIQYKEALKQFWGSHGDDKLYKINIIL